MCRLGQASSSGLSCLQGVSSPRKVSRALPAGRTLPWSCSKSTPPVPRRRVRSVPALYANKPPVSETTSLLVPCTFIEVHKTSVQDVLLLTCKETLITTQEAKKNMLGFTLNCEKGRVFPECEPPTMNAGGKKQSTIAFFCRDKQASVHLAEIHDPRAQRGLSSKQN